MAITKNPKAILGRPPSNRIHADSVTTAGATTASTSMWRVAARRTKRSVRIDREHQRDGIFVKTTIRGAGDDAGAVVRAAGYEPFKLEGEVAWSQRRAAGRDNPNPGMGVRFVELAPRRADGCRGDRTIPTVRDAF